jgi:hypothetical protein
MVRWSNLPHTTKRLIECYIVGYVRLCNRPKSIQCFPSIFESVAEGFLQFWKMSGWISDLGVACLFDSRQGIRHFR